MPKIRIDVDETHVLVVVEPGELQTRGETIHFHYEPETAEALGRGLIAAAQLLQSQRDIQT